MTAANRIAPPDSGVNVVMLEKKATGERYIFMVDDDPINIGEAIRTMGRFAVDPHLSFTWPDAACLALRLRESQAGK